MDWEDALDLCDEIDDLLEDLPDGAANFALSVEEKVSNMRDWIEENEHVTDKMVSALENMKSGCEKWL